MDFTGDYESGEFSIRIPRVKAQGGLSRVRHKDDLHRIFKAGCSSKTVSGKLAALLVLVRQVEELDAIDPDLFW